MTPHHFHCAAARGGNSRNCDCGVSGPRHWRIDHLPDRPMTTDEAYAWRHAIRAKAPLPAHEDLDVAHAHMEAGE